MTETWISRSVVRWSRLTLAGAIGRSGEQLVALHRALLHVGCALICWNFVARL